MSHKLNMYVRNDSSYELKSFSVSHTWDGHTNKLSGTNLGKGERSAPQEITSGYNQNDWYVVQITFSSAEKSEKMTDFYCNSSHSEKAVTLYIHDDYLDCAYSQEANAPDVHSSSCNKKHWT